MLEQITEPSEINAFRVRISHMASGISIEDQELDALGLEFFEPAGCACLSAAIINSIVC
ncbi:hypothetical protein [Brevibacillus migulae]|uniref:hypothetical protein n=1 Tax=Brevibacillus migulae TaxID=1644114 RepID=UPI001431D247|nr:hypothetical protein [Brevibacillus migulae]